MSWKKKGRMRGHKFMRKRREDNIRRKIKKNLKTKLIIKEYE